jgi:hypothetical protein
LFSPLGRVQAASDATLLYLALSEPSRASINSQNACFAWDHYNHGSVLIRHRGCDTNAARVLSILKLLQFRKEEEEKKHFSLCLYGRNDTVSLCGLMLRLKRSGWLQKKMFLFRFCKL